LAFGASSAIFQQAMLNPLLGKAFGTTAPTTFGSLTADTITVALFNNTTTPDKTVSAANSCYAVAQWVVGNEVIDSVGPGTNWAAAGRNTGAKTISIDTGSSSICFQTAALAGAGNVSIANAYGCLVYDNTITSPADQGICYNSFGGSAQGVVAGTFTILWATVGALTNVVVWNVTV
jgi:hypothetical protein